MKKNQYDILKGLVSEPNKVISINDLIDKSDRTLLYGYTCERKTWHIYIKKEEIWLVVYSKNYRESEDKVNIIHSSNKFYDNREYIPDKRLYPEACDFEFCELLTRDKDIILPFTTWNDERLEMKYHGYVIE